MKYRPLTSEELQPLEKEFVEFLVVNGIVADEWKQLQENDLPKANAIIDSFSDVVFESIMQRVKFLDRVLQTETFAFQCLQKEMILMHLKVNVPEVDLTLQPLHEIVSRHPDSITLSTQRKSYNQNREQEIFDMIEKGCAISEGTAFKLLSLVYAEHQPKN